MFLTTPSNGLKDFYLKVSYMLPLNDWGMKSFSPSINYHSFSADHLGAGIGSEWDAQGEVVVDTNMSFLVKYANYQGSNIAVGGSPDKSIFWLQTVWKY